jgi:hypothetical protein
MRGSSVVMRTIFNFLSLPHLTPSWYTGRLWMMRIGLYKLNMAKEKADDWIWIIDHSVQMGIEKLLLILCIRKKDLPVGRALNFSDVEVLDLQPVKKSNGEIVYRQLESNIAKTGVPVEIISDHGSDLKKGIDTFLKKHEEVAYVHDIKHAIANILKKELGCNELWKEFISLCASSKRKLQQTLLAAIAPPNQRSKSRYMNLRSIIVWAQNILCFISNKNEVKVNGFEYTLVNEKLGWIVKFSCSIVAWTQILDIAEKAESYVREKGLFKGASQKFEKSIEGLKLSGQAKSIKEKLIKLIEIESEKAGQFETLLGTSEIIESVFGKFKNVEQEQTKSGITGLTLALPAFIGKLTPSLIYDALIMVPTDMVYKWQKKYIGKSLQSQRKGIFGKRDKKEQIQDQAKVAA